MKLFYNTKISQKVLELTKKPQFQQRTPEWLEARQKCISASDVSKALMQSSKSCDYYMESFKDVPGFSFKINEKKCCDSYSSTRELIEKKCNRGKPFTGNIFTLHGQKYEQVVSNIYSQLHKVDVLEFGLLIHPEYSFLGASPDGITTEGIMIEIKCPPCRQVKPFPPLHYFQQMLLQLECTGLDECHYIDAHFVEYIDQESWYLEAIEWQKNNATVSYHKYGIIVVKILESGEGKNLYPTLDVVTVDQFLQWKDSIIETLDHDHTVSFYKLNEYYIAKAYANKEWITMNLPEIENVWKQIEYHRTIQGGIELDEKIDSKEKAKATRAPRKKKTLLCFKTSLFT